MNKSFQKQSDDEQRRYINLTNPDENFDDDDFEYPFLHDDDEEEEQKELEDKKIKFELISVLVIVAASFTGLFYLIGHAFSSKD